MTFKQTPLNEFITLQRGFDLPKGDRVEGGIPVVASTGVGGYHNESKVKAPGVVIGRSGSIGGGQYITDDFWPLNTTLWIKDFKGHDPRYVYYLMRSIDFTKFNVGSGVPTLNRNHLSSLLVNELGVGKEKSIAKYLGDIDDKIDLNTQVNQNLEQMAQVIFKSWFVDFDPVKAKMNGEQPEGMDAATASLFPEKIVESELGLIPEGWDIGSIEDVTSKVFSGGTPATKNEEFWGGDLPWFSSGETRSNVIIGTQKYITEAGVTGSSTKASTYGDVLIASAGQGHTRGQTSFNSIDCYINQSVVALRAADSVSAYWLYYNLERRYDEMRSVSDSHSSRGSLTTKLLKGMPAIIPSKELVIAFDCIVESLVRKQVANSNQNEELSALRDTLLPKLLSGEIELETK